MTRADLVQPSLRKTKRRDSGQREEILFDLAPSLPLVNLTQRPCSLVQPNAGISDLAPFDGDFLSRPSGNIRTGVMLCTAPRSGHTAEHNITPAEQTIRLGVMPGQRRLVPAPHRASKTGNIQTGVKPVQATLPGTTPTRTPSGRSDGCPASTWTTDTPASRRRESRAKRRDFWTYNIGAASPQSFPVKPMRQRRAGQERNRTAPMPLSQGFTAEDQERLRRTLQSGSTEPEFFPSPQATPERIQAPCPSHQGNVRTGNVPPAPTTRVNPSPSHTPATSSGEILAARTCLNLSGPRRATSTNQSKV